MPLQLNVEVVQKSESIINSKNLSNFIEKDLKSRNFLTTGTKITEFEGKLEEHVKAIHICELEVIEENDILENVFDKINETVNVNDILFKIHIIRMNREVSEAIISGEDDVAAHYWTLPTEEFHTLWDSLIFDSNIKERLLQYCETLTMYSKMGVDNNLVASSRVVLLHGPPGTGKTSLCKGLASKLAVRMSSSYNNIVLVEVNAHSLFSKFFSESGKLVTKMFQTINELIDDSKKLVCVLIDEIESLAHSRASAASGIEPSDSFRVVNSVLTQLDLIKMKPNVLILTTSNITGAIDVAFIDRADIKQYIPRPSSIAVYSIFYSCLIELLRVGLLTGQLPKRITNPSQLVENGCTSDDDSQLLLIILSKKSMGLSGRAMRKIPLLAHSYYITSSTPATLHKFLRAMIKVVESRKEDLEIVMNGSV